MFSKNKQGQWEVKIPSAAFFRVTLLCVVGPCASDGPALCGLWCTHEGEITLCGLQGTHSPRKTSLLASKISKCAL